MSAESRRLLWVVPKWPFPVQDGARIATVNLVRHLTRQGAVIDLLAVAAHDEYCDVEEARRELGVINVHVIRRGGPGVTRLETALKMGRSMLARPRVPLTMGYYAATPVSRQMNELFNTSAGMWRTVVYDGLHPAIHSSSQGEFIRPRGVSQVIYRAHNFEAGIWDRKAEQTGNTLKKAFLNHQAKLVRAFECSLARQADALLTVSDEDLVQFRKSCEGQTDSAHWNVIPIGYEFGDEMPEIPQSDSLQLMFLGRLDWHPNRDGMLWFLKEVWPVVSEKRPELKLVVAGSGKSDWIQPFLGMRNLQFLGRVPSVEKLYQDSVLSLVPVFYGSGTRVKVIEASRFGRACLSTAIGVEGVGLQEGMSYLRAETANQWIQALLELSHAEASEIGQRAYSGLKERFDAAATASRFLSVMGTRMARETVGV